MGKRRNPRVEVPQGHSILGIALHFYPDLSVVRFPQITEPCEKSGGLVATPAKGLKPACVHGRSAESPTSYDCACLQGLRPAFHATADEGYSNLLNGSLPQRIALFIAELRSSKGHASLVDQHQIAGLEVGDAVEIRRRL